MATRLGVQPPGVQLAELRAGGYQDVVVQAWQAAGARAEQRAVANLRNTDGDPLLLVEEEFAFAREGRAPLLAALEAASFERDPDGDSNQVVRFTWLKTKRNDPHGVLAGTLRVERDKLVAETNSRKRASALRKKLEKAASGRLTHVRRSETDPRAAAAQRAASADPEDEDAEPEPLPAEARAAVRTFKATHWRDWIDQPIPALDGLTPRAAAATPEGRRKVALLLKDAEYHEGHLDPADRFDFTPIRKALGV